MRVCVRVHVCVCVCVCVCVRAYRHNPEDVSKVFLLILHLVLKLGLFSLSRHMFSAISASQNHKMFKERKKCRFQPRNFLPGEQAEAHEAGYAA